MLSSEKSTHLLQIISAGTTGIYAESMLQVKTVDDIVHWIQVGAQIMIAVVTAWATIRKAMQQPKVISPAQTEE